MLNMLVTGMLAYNQMGLFFGALICLVIGGLFGGDAFYWRVHARRATGTIVGVIDGGQTFTPVYRYVLDGQTHVARSTVGSNLVRGMATGRTVRLLISPHDPAEAKQSDDWTGEVVGAAFLGGGAWLGWTALTAFPLTPMTGIMAAGFLITFVERGMRVFWRNGPHASLAQWIALARHGGAGDIDMSEVKPIESLVSADALNTTWRDQLAAQKKRAWIPALIAVVFALIAVDEGADMFRYETGGSRTSGKVIDIVGSDSTDGHWTYRALVRFRVAGERIDFYDRVGGNPPVLRMGDRVSVLYFPQAPASAIVDRGLVENMLLPAALLLVAGLAGWIAWVGLTTRVRRDGAIDPAPVPAE